MLALGHHLFPGRGDSTHTGPDVYLQASAVDQRSGADGWDRTTDLLITNEVQTTTVLHQQCLAVEIGVEPI